MINLKEFVKMAKKWKFSCNENKKILKPKDLETYNKGMEDLLGTDVEKLSPEERLEKLKSAQSQLDSEEQEIAQMYIDSEEELAKMPKPPEEPEEPKKQVNKKEKLPSKLSGIYNGEATPSWLKSTSALKLLAIMEDFGTDQDIQNSMDLLLRAAIVTAELPSPKEGFEIPDGEIENFQKKLSLKVDADVGPATFGAACLLVSKKYNTLVAESKMKKLFNSHSSNGFRYIIENSLSGEAKYGVIAPDTYIDKCASSRSLRDALRGLDTAGFSIKKPARASGRFSSRSLNYWRDDKEFLSEAERIAKKHRMTRAQFLALIWHETSFTMSPRVENHMGFTGLIQFETMEGSKKAQRIRREKGRPLNNKDATIVGLSRAMGRGNKPFTKKELKSMTRTEQLKLVDAYIEMRFKGEYPKDEFMLGRIYCSIIYPVGRRLPSDYPVFARGPEVYAKFPNHPYLKSKARMEHAAGAFKSNAKKEKYRAKGYITIEDFQEIMEKHIRISKLDF